MKFGSLFRRNYPIVRTSCDGSEFAIRAIAASLATRDTPERIHQVQRTRLFARLTQQERLNELDAEHWISRWEREAAARGLERGRAFWDSAWDWIGEQRQSAD